jgi:plasmid maintenance system antidote protein VapI
MQNVSGKSLKNCMRPVHPGEVIRGELMAPVGLSANALAKVLNVPTPRERPVFSVRT